MSNEAFEGYRDGFADNRDTLPESLANRSNVYRVAWENGRDDRLGRPRASAAQIRTQMTQARRKDDHD